MSSVDGGFNWTFEHLIQVCVIDRALLLASLRAYAHVCATSSLSSPSCYTLFACHQMGSDVREPHFLIMNNQLIFSFFQAGTDPLAFEPQFLFHMTRSAAGVWSDYTTWGQPGEIAWQIGVNNGTAYASSYLGVRLELCLST